MVMNKEMIINNMENVGDFKKIYIGEAWHVVDLGSDEELENDVQKVAELLKLNKETLITLNFAEMNKGETKIALFIDKVLTETRTGKLKWYEASEKLYGVVKDRCEVTDCDLPLIDLETGLFTSHDTTETFEFEGEAVVADLKNGYRIINLVYNS